ncbi:MAG: DUF465 domain-containing protein [Deltaproteobacteria bacterium]|jgi:hypothetical protein
MEERDERLIAQLIGKNQELRKYVEQHRQYEKQLEEYNKRIHLTTEEAIQRKKLQKRKLAGRDKIERILAKHRTSKKSVKAR